MKPFYRDAATELFNADAVATMQTFQPKSFRMIITDPPYSSGALHAAGKRRSPEEKYAQNGNARGRATFSGDMKDQRSFGFWCTQWLSLGRELLEPGGYCLVFTDWRQLPMMTDAFQAADLVWRGVIAWDKGNGSRAPHKGYFRHQCEYIVWGTRGPCHAPHHAGPFPGCVFAPVLPGDKHHQTGKPTKLLRELVRTVPADSLILDPFAGSATTLVAAKLEGRRAVGIEREQPICEVAAARLRDRAKLDQLARGDSRPGVHFLQRTMRTRPFENPRAPSRIPGIAPEIP